MKKANRFAKKLPVMICLVLIAAVALALTGCRASDNGGGGTTVSVGSTVSSKTAAEIGEGKTQFNFTVVHKDGTEKVYSIKTDESTVGAALVKEGLISGDEGQYGLYVKTVDGETVDYDTDKMFWAFYIGDKMASTGVDHAEITAGESYVLKAQK